MMMTAVEKIFTPEDLLNDSSLAGYELVDGHLRERRVSEASGLIVTRILYLLESEAKRTGEALVYPSEMGYQCFPDSQNTVRFPDVSVLRKSRRAEVGPDPSYMPIPADLAVEVLSPNDRVREIEDKIKDYLGAGFALVWIVNPYGRHVQVYRPGAGVQMIDEHGEITAEPALAQFRCKVAEFFNV